MTDVATKTKVPDLAAREKALALYEAHHKAFNAEADADKSISNEAYAALEKAEKDTAQAVDDFGLHVMTNNKVEPIRCPMCKCQLLEEDLE